MRPRRPSFSTTTLSARDERSKQARVCTRDGFSPTLGIAARPHQVCSSTMPRGSHGAAVDGARYRPHTLAIMLAILAERRRPVRLFVCAMLAAILYLPGLGKPALWEPDEGRYAEIAREMVVSGDYVPPRDHLALHFEKPPLVYWANAASIKIFGVNEFAVRLPAALFSVGQVVVT